MAFLQNLNEVAGDDEDKRSGHSLSGDERFEKSAEPERFTKLVTSLEVKACSRLNPPARELCLRAFLAAPESFEILVMRAHEKARSSPIGLLIAMVKNGEHLVGIPPHLWDLKR
jgi:hypothetical protein